VRAPLFSRHCNATFIIIVNVLAFALNADLCELLSLFSQMEKIQIFDRLRDRSKECIRLSRMPSWFLLKHNRCSLCHFTSILGLLSLHLLLQPAICPLVFHSIIAPSLPRLSFTLTPLFPTCTFAHTFLLLCIRWLLQIRDSHDTQHKPTIY
jgi:hypothetical protein